MVVFPNALLLSSSKYSFFLIRIAYCNLTLYLSVDVARV